MDGTRNKVGLHGSIGHHISRAARVIERRIEEDLRPFGLTRIGWSILVAVHEEGKQNPSDIASFIGIDRTATSRALRTLEASGLIMREMGRVDRRTTEVTLTDLGEAQFVAALPRCREAVHHFHAKLTPGELDTLKKLLQTLSAFEDEV